MRMFYFLADHYKNWLDAHRGFRAMRVFRDITFQSTLAIVLSFLLCILLGPAVIGWLTRLKIRDMPDFDQADINKLMADKKGVPTMGGLLIIISFVVTVLLLGL